MAKNRNNKTSSAEQVEPAETQVAETEVAEVVEAPQQDAPAPVAAAEEKKIPEPKAAEAEVVVDKPTMVAEESKFEIPKRPGACGEPKSQRGVLMKDLLDNFIANTAPNVSVSQANGGLYTGALIRHLTGPTLGASYEDFKDVMDIFIENVKANIEGAFARRYALRFIPDVSGVTRAQVALYENIYAASVQVAAVGKAQAAKGIDMNKFTSYVDNEQAVANLTEYFKG